MTLRVSGKNLAIGEALRTHVHGRIDGLVAKYHAGQPIGHVTIEPEGSGYRSDCTLFLRAGITLQVEAVAQEPYACFDKAADRIERRLRDHRKRIQDRHSDTGAGTSPTTPDANRSADLDLAALPDPDAVIEGAFAAIVAEPVRGLDEMTVAAAARALDDTDCPVLVFRTADTQRVNFVYRRSDGNIGWIDPVVAVAGPVAGIRP